MQRRTEQGQPDGRGGIWCCLNKCCVPGLAVGRSGTWVLVICIYRCPLWRSCSVASWQGQAIYCQASAMQSQGLVEDALKLYQQAAELWQGQPVVLLGVAKAHQALKQPKEALAAVQRALALDAGCRADGLAQTGLRTALLTLQAQLEAECSE